MSCDVPLSIIGMCVCVHVTSNGSRRQRFRNLVVYRKFDFTTSFVPRLSRYTAGVYLYSVPSYNVYSRRYTYFYHCYCSIIIYYVAVYTADGGHNLYVRGLQKKKRIKKKKRKDVHN